MSLVVGCDCRSRLVVTIVTVTTYETFMRMKIDVTTMAMCLLLVCIVGGDADILKCCGLILLCLFAEVMCRWLVGDHSPHHDQVSVKHTYMYIMMPKHWNKSY